MKNMNGDKNMMKKRGKNMNNAKNRYRFSKKYLTAGLIGAIVLMGMLAKFVQGTTTRDTGMNNDAESTEPTYIKASNDDDDFRPPHHRHHID